MYIKAITKPLIIIPGLTIAVPVKNSSKKFVASIETKITLYSIYAIIAKTIKEIIGLSLNFVMILLSLKLVKIIT